MRDALGDVAGSGKKRFDSAAEGGGFGDVGADDEDGVVARDGADDIGPAFEVDGGGDGLGAAGGGDEDDEIHGLARFHPEAVEDAFDAGEIVACLAGRDAVAGGTFRELELADITRERGLGDVEAAAGEAYTELILIGHKARAEDVADGGLALPLHWLDGADA